MHLSNRWKDNISVLNTFLKYIEAVDYLSIIYQYQEGEWQMKQDNIEGIDYDDFKLLSEGLTDQQRNKTLANFRDYLNQQKKYFLGYQVNNNMNYEEDLKYFVNMHINNVGDPFISGNLTMNSKPMERAVLDYYAELWNAVTPHDKKNPESYWGYTLSMGSTEGNVYAIWNARDYLSGKILLIDEDMDQASKMASLDGVPVKVPCGFSYCQAEAPIDNENAYTPVAFYSQDTHYSIVKSMRVLNFQTFYALGSQNYKCPLKYPDDYPEGFSEKYLGIRKWPLEVPSNPDGSIHIPSLTKLVEFFVEKGYPIFVCFNSGTTFKGAYDNVEKAVNALVPILKENNMYERDVAYKQKCKYKTGKRNGFWFHVDGALGAAYLPFVEKAIKEERFELPKDFEFPVFDFRIPEVHSIVMSSHKWIGSPYCCGLFMTKTKYQLLPPDDPMYIGSPDTTFAGSRNGLAPMILWDYLARNSDKTQIQKAIRTEEMAKYAEGKLKELEVKLQKDLWVDRSPLSLTIRFKRPIDEIIFKYSLSCESLYVNGVEHSYVHIFAMEHVTEELIDMLVDDLSKPGAFSDLEENSVTKEKTESEVKQVHTEIIEDSIGKSS